MKTANIAEAKSHFSALLADVEAGEEVVITRRGKPIARIVSEPASASPVFDLAALRAFVQAQPCRESLSVADMREQDLL
jgi:prevent-host-death family protein